MSGWAGTSGPFQAGRPGTKLRRSRPCAAALQLHAHVLRLLVQPFTALLTFLMAGDHHVVLFAVLTLLIKNLFPHRPLQRCRRQLQRWRISPAVHDEVAGIFVVHHLIKFVSFGSGTQCLGKVDRSASAIGFCGSGHACDAPC
jgi:hypothetical protein